MLLSICVQRVNFVFVFVFLIFVNAAKLILHSLAWP